MKKLIDFLNRLDKVKIYYTLDHTSDDSVLVSVAVPGQIWEVQFMLDGEVAIEKFVSKGEIYEEQEIERLFKDFSE